MIVENTRGFGLVEHPETGENINVEEPFETDEKTFELLDDTYPGFRIVEESDDSGDGTEDTEDNTEICGTEMSDGSICERPADECAYH